MHWLLLALSIKHFLADFPLQTQYMLGKGKREGWVDPLLAHCNVHASLTWLVLVAFGVGYFPALGIAGAEGIAHFGIDRLKAHPDLGGRWNPSQPQFWWALGADQLAHNLCYLAIAVGVS
jgi:hypothetical protein